MKLSDIKDIIMSNEDDILPGSYIIASEFEYEQNLIYESLIKSYPIESIIAAVHSSTYPNGRIAAEYIDDTQLFNSFTLIIEIKNNQPIDVNDLLHSAKVYGWVIPIILFFNEVGNKLAMLSKKDITQSKVEEVFEQYTDISQVKLKFEAKYDVELEKKRWPSELYCIAPITVKHKIERNGLVPKAGRNVDHELDRIYFAFNKEDLINDMLPQLKRNNASYQKGTLLITIDTSKLPGNVRLFQDVNWPGQAVFTLVNVPQTCFKNVETM
jgi:hypothetical protein